MVGLLLRIGRGREPRGAAAAALLSGVRPVRIKAAPAHGVPCSRTFARATRYARCGCRRPRASGLFLDRVWYCGEGDAPAEYAPSEAALLQHQAARASWSGSREDWLDCKLYKWELRGSAAGAGALKRARE